LKSGGSFGKGAEMEQELPLFDGLYRKKVIEIELSDKCDLYCVGCFTDRGSQSKRDVQNAGISDPQLLTMDEIDRILRQAKQAGFQSVLSSGHGEPTFDRQRFWDFIEIINKYEMIPVIASHCYWVSEEDAARLFEENVSMVSKVWSLSKEKSQQLIHDPQDRPFAVHDGAEIPVGIKNVIMVYTDEKNITRKGYKLLLNTVVHGKTKDELIEILEWDRRNRIIPYFEFIFSSGRARHDPSIWLDGEAGETLYKEPYTEIKERERIVEQVVAKDRELGFFYDQPAVPTGKVGQDSFDNTDTLIINPYGYAVSCPAIANFMRGEDREILDARYSFDKIIPLYDKCGSCTSGNYSCDADLFDREVRNPVIVRQ
jgi:MoaA/NifB/PqqE/SkfB family radical SAM enzyme